MSDFVLPSRYKIIDFGENKIPVQYGRRINSYGQIAVGIATHKRGSDGKCLNKSKQVSPYSLRQADVVFHAFRCDKAGITELGSLGGDSSFGEGINDRGQVSGWSKTAGNTAIHAVIWTGNSIADLGTLGGTNSRGYGINSQAQVAGYSDTAEDKAYHAVRWTGAALADLGALCRGYSIGNGINNSGVVVGWSQTASSVPHAFVAPNDTMIDLNTLLPPGSEWTLMHADHIDDNGWITGQGIHNGQMRAYLLVPEY